MVAVASGSCLAQDVRRGVGGTVVTDRAQPTSAGRLTGAMQTPIGAMKSSRTPFVQLAVDDQGRTIQPFLFKVGPDNIDPQIYFRADILIRTPPQARSYDLVFCNRALFPDPRTCYQSVEDNVRQAKKITRLRAATPAWDALLVDENTQKELARLVSRTSAGCYFILWRELGNSEDIVSVPFVFHSGRGSALCQ